MIYLGIDPGKCGALAVLDDKGKFISVHDCPLDQGELDLDGMAELVRNITAGGEACATIEKVGTMPHDGRVGAFNFGKNFGAWQGVLASHHVGFKLVPPQTWMAAVFGKNKWIKGKARSLELARLSFPQAELKLVKHDGRAEALLIAEYGRRIATVRTMSRKY